MHTTTKQNISNPHLQPPTLSWLWAILGFGLALACSGFLYWETVSYLIKNWNQLELGEFSHGYLVCAISLFLVWRDRTALSSMDPEPDFWGLIPTLGAGILWFLATVVDIQLVQAFSLFLLLASLVRSTLGKAIFMRLIFPITFLIFAIPVWSFLLPMLQEFTTIVVYSSISAMGVPALLEGHVIRLPAGVFHIEEACSGLRYLLAGMTLSALYAYLNYSKPRSRIAVFALVASASILANLLRVFIVVYLGYRTDMQHPLVDDHLTLGWILFSILIVLLLIVDIKYHRAEPNPQAVRALPKHRKSPTRAPNPKRFALVFSALVLALTIGPAAAYWIQNEQHLALNKTPSTLALPSNIGEWQGPLETNDDWSPKYQGVATETKGAYRKNGSQIHLYIGYYLSQSQGKELINDTNNITGDKAWRSAYSEIHPINVNKIPLLQTVLSSTRGQKRLVWYRYEVAGHSTNKDALAKLLQLWGMFTGHRYAAIIALAADYDDDIEKARTELGDFLKTMTNPLHQTLVEFYSNAQDSMNESRPPIN